MPSDPSGVHPQGVLVRPAPDFFDDNMAFGGFQLTIATGNNFVLTSLYNDATTGIALKVYAISCSGDGGGGCSAWMDQNLGGSTLVGQCSNVAANLGAPFGQIWQNTQTIAGPFPNPFNPPPSVAMLGTNGFDSVTHVFPFPAFIIPAGFALHVTNNNGSELLGASFWYQQSNE